MREAYCAICGQARETSTHLFSASSYHEYVPRLLQSKYVIGYDLPLLTEQLRLLNDEEKQIIRWLKEWWNDPTKHGGIYDVLEDCGQDIISDLCKFLRRYSDAYEDLKSRTLSKESDRGCD